jgi:ferredoxin
VHVEGAEAYGKLLPEGEGGERKVPEAEMDMLDLAADYKEGKSRLGCQLKMPKEGLSISLPSGVNDFWK